MKLKIVVAVLILGVSQIIMGKMPEKGLVARWKLNGNAFDSVGGRNGKVIDVSFAEKGETGYAVFDGKKSCIKIINADEQFVKDNKISISAWINKKSDWTDKDGSIVSLGGFYGGWRVFLSNLKEEKDPAQLAFTLGGKDVKVRSSLYLYRKKIESDTWYNIVFTWDGLWMRGYIDGKQVLSIRANKPYNQKEKYWLGIGFNGQGVGHFKGFIRDVCLWERSLSKSEIIDVFKSQKKGNGGLVKVKQTEE